MATNDLHEGSYKYFLFNFHIKHDAKYKTRLSYHKNTKVSNDTDVYSNTVPLLYACKDKKYSKKLVDAGLVSHSVSMYIKLIRYV